MKFKMGESVKALRFGQHGTELAPGAVVARNAKRRDRFTVRFDDGQELEFQDGSDYVIKS